MWDVCPTRCAVFHLSHAMAKGYALSSFGRLRQAQQALAPARQRLEALPASPRAWPGAAGTSRGGALRSHGATLAGCGQRRSAASVHPVTTHTSLASDGRNPSDVTGGGTRVAWRAPGTPNMAGNERVAGQIAPLGLGLQAACWGIGADRLLVADGVARLGAQGHVPEVDAMGGGAAAAAPVLAETTVTHALSRAQGPDRPGAPDSSRRLSGIRAPGGSRPKCSQAGNRGPVSMPEPSRGRPRRWKVAMASLRRCSTITVVCPCVATRYGRGGTTLMVAPPMERPSRTVFQAGVSRSL
jgi:hypothetical protein